MSLLRSSRRVGLALVLAVFALPALAQVGPVEAARRGEGEIERGREKERIVEAAVRLAPDQSVEIEVRTPRGETHRYRGTWSQGTPKQHRLRILELPGDSNPDVEGWVRVENGHLERIEMNGRAHGGHRYTLAFEGSGRDLALPAHWSTLDPNRPDPNRLRRDDFTEEWGFDQPGGDYRRERAGDVGQCQQLCASDSRCRAYTFNTRDQVCYLKESERPLSRRIDTVSGVKRMSSAGGFGERPGYDLEGGDYASVYQPTLEACQQACASDRQCAAYAYNTRSRICYLKDRVGNYVSRYEMVSGVKPQRR